VQRVGRHRYSVGAGSVTSVVVNCATERFTVGGIVDGLAGAVVLQNNAGDSVTVSSNGSFAFPTTLLSGATYAVTVLTQPATPSQTCVVSSGTGTVTSFNVTSVRVSCTTNSFTVAGTVTGLAGSGLVLQNNSGDSLPITANGVFIFPIPVLSATAYSVTVLSQPSNLDQACVVTGGSGIVGGGDVTSVVINCTTNRYTISGTLFGLSGQVVLENNLGDDVTLMGNGGFAFSMTVPSGSPYSVTVLTPPTSPNQTCVVTSGTGIVTNADVTDVIVQCTTDSYTIGGTVNGLASGESVTLSDNVADSLMQNTNGTFVFMIPVANGSTYTVSVSAQPGSPIQQTCVITNGAGTVGTSNITNVIVNCAP
jgi:hypothetical protein